MQAPSALRRLALILPNAARGRRHIDVAQGMAQADVMMASIDDCVDTRQRRADERGNV